MRYPILTFMILFSCSLINGQYKSIFGTESTSWYMILEGYCDGVTTTEVKVTSDTVINGKDFKTISRYESGAYKPGFLREDTLEGKVWFLNDELEEELLVVDMSLETNDTFEIYDYKMDAYKVFVDTVFYAEGLKHIRFREYCHISICAGEYSPLLEFIEGSGTNAGLFSNINGFHFDMASYLLCHFKDEVKIYGNKLFNDTCFVEEVGIRNVISKPLFKVYPNPGSDILCVEILDDQLYETSLTIYNELGALLIMKDHLMQKNIKIDVSSLSAGVYFIRLEIPNEKNLGIRKYVKK